MNNQLVVSLTTLALATNLAVVGVVDVYLLVRFGPEDTVTALVHSLSKQYPAIPLAVGMLIGHLFL